MSEMYSDYKEVDFKHWCPKCKHRDVKETMDPCNECLEVGMREGTRKPEYFKER